MGRVLQITFRNQGIGTYKKKLDSWNEVIEKVNKDFHENRKEFWAYVGRTSEGSRKGIASLRVLQVHV